MAKHEQVLYKTSRGQTVKVDEDLLDVLNALRDHKVLTLFSCQGTDEQHAYILATRHTAKKLIKRILKAFDNGLYSLEVADFVNRFKTGRRRWEMAIYRDRGENEVFKWKYVRGSYLPMGFSIEQSYHNVLGFRTCVRWPTNQTDILLKLLKQTPKK